MSSASFLFSAAISAVLGFGLAHYLSKKISANSKAKKVLNFLIFISLGVGFTGVLNELFMGAFLGLGTRMDKVTIFVFSNILVLPSLFFGVGMIVDRFNKDSNIESDTSIHKVDSPKWSLNPKLFLISISTVIFLFLGVTFGSNFIASDEFKFSSCTRCDETKQCSSFAELKGFKVLDNSIQIYMLDENQMDRMFSLPTDEKMKCTITKNRNNSFECSSHTVNEVLTSDVEIAFDGKKKFIYNNFSNTFSGNVYSAKTTCKID